jgi:DUF1680 family protein
MHAVNPIILSVKSNKVELKSVPVTNVKFTDRFWAPRLQVNNTITLHQQYTKLWETGRIDNFLRVIGKSDKPFTPPVFNDSDVYKWLEAASWGLAYASDQNLREKIDTVVDIVVQSQGTDGYINTYYALERESLRWENIRDMHELYCAGHLFQAAVAHHRCLGDSRLLECAMRFANYLCTHFLNADSQKTIPPGHPEIEMALVELWRETHNKKYLDLAQAFLDSRGHGLIGGREYHQDHIPFRNIHRLTGHAVRALYLSAGAADIAMEKDDLELKQVLQHLWQHLVSHQIYITGGIGSRHSGESIGRDYELPNGQAYAETCAAIAAVMWAWRMLQMEGECQYADYIEHIMYNAVLPGVSLDGTSYFYVNPLADDGTHRRQDWFQCACCPPNLSRILAMMPGMIYSVSDDTVWVHQYAANESTLTLPDGKIISILQRTRYPWDGNVIVEILNDCDISLCLRMPKWCDRPVEININGNEYTEISNPGTYIKISRKWAIGDSVCIQFPMPVKYMQAHPYIRENNGQTALMRGPILYCVEAVDHPNINLLDLMIDLENAATSSFQPHNLNGIQVLEVPAILSTPGPYWDGILYTERPSILSSPKQSIVMEAVPYFAWGNRSAGQMLVWLRESD